MRRENNKIVVVVVVVDNHACALSCADVFCVLRSSFTNSSFILNLHILKTIQYDG